MTKPSLFSLKYDRQIYGRVRNNNATMEFGQSFQRNSFRPIVIFEWTNNKSRTEIKGYYSVALSVISATILIPLFGLYLSIKISNILPVLLLSSIWIIMYTTFGKWLFMKDFKWVEEEFLKLVDKKDRPQ